jgi:signal peptidase I
MPATTTLLAGLGGLAGLAVLGGAALWAHRRLVLVTVHGTSMEPTLSDGARVLVRRRRLAQLTVGDVAVLESPEAARAPEWQCAGWHVKRVAALPGDPLPAGIPAPGATRVPPDTVVVLGDNPAGGDSRHWGPYPTTNLVGTVLCRLTPGRPTPPDQDGQAGQDGQADQDGRVGRAGQAGQAGRRGRVVER